MAIPTTIESLSTTAASNGPAGSEQRTLADDGLRQAYAFIAQMVNAGTDIASASTITPPSTGSSFHITGTTSITTIASTNSWNGRTIVLIFDGILTFTHSSNLALPGSANITTAANDVAIMRQNASGAWRCIHYQPAASLPITSYLPLAGGTLTGGLTGTTASFTGNVTLGNDGGDTVTTNGTFSANAPTSGGHTLTGNSSASLGNTVKFVISGGQGFYLNSNSSGTLNTLAVGTGETLAINVGSSQGLVLTSDLRFYGTALHNNAGAVTGTTNQYIASGTYTPTTNTGLGNVTSATANLCQWTRVGNVVTVSGSVAVDPVAASTRTIVGLSLPIASNFTAQSNCAGSAAFEDASNVYSAGFVLADATNDIALLSVKNTTDTASNNWYFSFTYLVL